MPSVVPPTSQAQPVLRSRAIFLGTDRTVITLLIMAKKAPLTKQTSGNKNPKAQSSFVLKPFFHVNPREIRNAIKNKISLSTAAAVITLCSG